jgi:hypothetical protein
MPPYQPDDPHPSDEPEIKDLEELGAPVPGDSMTDNFEPYAYTMVEGPDGLPVEDTPPWQSADSAPIPLTPETVQCLPQKPGKHTPEGLPACSHYKRQRVHNPTAPDRPIIQRFCTHPSLRGINGACLSLDDAGVFECEFRDPIDPRAKLVLDMLDHHKIKLGRERLQNEVKTGKVHGFRLFRTPEDVAAGRFTLSDDDIDVVDLNRDRLSQTSAPSPDPFAPDDDEEANR